MTTLWNRLLDIVSPRLCPVCGARLSISETGLCVACNRELPRTWFVITASDNELARCFWGLMPISRAASLFYYTPKSATARLIYALKYFGQPDIGVTLGHIMATEFVPYGFFDGVDVLLPVPLSRKHRWQRGYNQNERIAYGISEVTGLPIDTHSLKRTKQTASQSQVGWNDKRDNVANAFALSPKADLTGKHVMIVDDIITSGSTMMACASAVTGQDVAALSVVSLGYTKT